MTIFVEVAKQQGFAPAARALNLSTSAVSRYVIDLEDWMGVQLFQRTTRKLSLTEAGKAYLDRCKRVVTEVKDIQLAASFEQAEPHGPLRISAPVFIAKDFLQDLLPGYLNRCPKVELELVIVDRFVDLVAEGFDLAIRAGELKDSTLIARKLIDSRLVLVASPIYIKEHGEPKSIADLKKHNCLIDTAPNYTNHWPVAAKSGAKPLAVNGNVRVNSGEIIRSLALAGVGIALLPEFFVVNDIRDGRLTSFLESNVHFSGGIFAVYPQHRHLSPSVRTFIDYLVGHIDQLELLYGNR
ncbi:MAG: LysR family transcriptional regulator [Candidatus Thiodiazotropha sp. (ex Lucinoma borealis)]|nr:LysR family transcriptional regulator [Candidatus Thiodiazotropha sp. (ex Lucinoma borealis)]MCU7875733.1 LysR family transcriptional regulator [Candidatus Thiodiazotropha sp. (ex Lucinoma borealis)]